MLIYIIEIDEDTFKVMWELSAPGGDAEGCFKRIHETEYFYDGRDARLNWMPDFTVLTEAALVPGAQTGVSFTTVTFDAPRYVGYLLARFVARGGTPVHGSVQHVAELAEGGPGLFARGRASAAPVDALVVCAGLGARTLGGVEDAAMYPVRGQTVLLRAPWVAGGRTASHAADGVWTYVIPRRCGEVSAYVRCVCARGTHEGVWIVVCDRWCAAGRSSRTTGTLHRALRRRRTSSAAASHCTRRSRRLRCARRVSRPWTTCVR